MKNLMNTTKVHACVCANVRQTDLVVTQFYDGILAPSGLYAIQYGIISVLAKLAPTTVNHPAESMDLDRVTLTRHLKILADQGLVRYEDGEDRYISQLLLTQEGEQVLSRALPLWQEAQERIVRALGQERYEALLAELLTVRTVLSSGVS